MNIKLLKLSLASSILVLAGCQSVLDASSQVEQPTANVSHNDSAWKQHVTQLKQIRSYNVTGQFGYISKQPKERFSSQFEWQYQDATHFNFELSSNLSSKSLKLQRTPSGLIISDSEGNQRRESDINGLMEEIIGTSFPIDQFGDWLKGLPSNDSDYVVNEKRQLSQFNYTVNGEVWKASYVQYHEDRTPNLPKLIVLENGNQTLKILVNEWKY